MQVFAHRGASAAHPENTLRAIRHALHAGVEGIEIDVQLAADEVLVFHDRWLHRTTNGKGRFRQQSLAHLRQLNAGDGETIPSLLEVLNLIHGQTTLNIELKHREVALPTLALVDFARDQLGFSAEQLLISSFNHQVLHQLHQLRPNLPLAMLTASLPVDIVAYCRTLGVQALHIDIDSFEPEWLNEVKAQGLQVRIYTVDEPEDWLMLAELGVDGIFTNYPQEAMRLLHPHEG